MRTLPQLELADARRIAAAARARAEAEGWAVVIAIVDEGGHLMFLERADATQKGSVRVAQEKARTALLFKRPTKAIEDAGKHGPSGGTIRVATAAPPGEVVVEISDDGGGIPPAVQEHMFEPFFTTKDVGRGTGQGLAIVRPVIERHRGVIEVETAVGVGTTIRIRLPTEEDGLRAGSP